MGPFFEHITLEKKSDSFCSVFMNPSKLQVRINDNKAMNTAMNRFEIGGEGDISPY